MVGREFVVERAPAEGLVHNLVIQGDKPMLVADQRIFDVGKIAITLIGGKLRDGSFVSLGYFCNFIEEYKTILGLKELTPDKVIDPIKAMLKPGCKVPGDTRIGPSRICWSRKITRRGVRLKVCSTPSKRYKVRLGRGARPQSSIY